MNEFFITCPFCKFDDYVDTKWGVENKCPQCGEGFYMVEEAYECENGDWDCFYMPIWTNSP